MDIYTLTGQLCEELNEYMDTPFHIYPQETYQEIKVKSWIEMIIAGETKLEVYLNYWGADEAKDIEDDYEVTDTYMAEVTFTEIYPWECTVSVHVLWNGDAAKAAFTIKDGEVDYISDFESEEDRKSRCCTPNDVYSESLSTEQKNAVDDLMETIRICLCHVMGDDE